MAKKIFWKKSLLIFFIFLIFILSIVMSFFMVKTYQESFELQEEVTFYVITLNTEERLKNIKNQQAKIKAKIHLFEGVDGRKLDISSVKDPEIAPSFIKEDKIRKNEIGCYMSHYRLYQKIASSGNPKGYTVILEDDFVLDDDFENKLTKGLEQFVEKDFDILFLENVAQNIGKKTETQQICEIDKKKDLYGLLGYLVKNANIQKVIQNTNHMTTAIDHQLENAIFQNELVAYTFCPFIVKQAGMPSLIQ